MKRTRGAAVVALGLVSLVTLAGCSSGAGGGQAAESHDDRVVGFVTDQDEGEPVEGGMLSFGSFVLPTSLDPTETRVAGATGGTELAAVYDVLMRSDIETGKFEPQLAKALDSNDDYTEYTLTLREGVTFSDGTPLDSAAVQWSIERYIDSQFDQSAMLSDILDEIETPDGQTVVFRLNRSWDRFPIMLSMGPGLIVAPSSVDGGDFTPIGAGPFTLTDLVPNEEISMTARDDYYGGRPHLDQLRFVPTSGAQFQIEALDSGEIDMSYLIQDEQVIDAAISDGYAGFLDIQGLGEIIIINQHEGRPGADVRVRQAVAYGVDPELYNERVQGGIGISSSNLLPDTSRWSSSVEGLEYDPDRARELLEEAKSDGYDGHIEMLTVTDPVSMAAALAVQASLNSIGFDVELDTVGSSTDNYQRVFGERDFDMTRTSLVVLDDAPVLRLLGSIYSKSTNNPQGYKDAEMDELILDVQTATTDAAKNEALSAVQQRINDTIPYAIFGPLSVFTVWDDDVHGVTRTVDNIWLFDDAWID